MAVIHFNAEQFERQVMGGTGLALVDFWASWCGPCRMLGPTIEALADELQNVVVGKVDIDEEAEVATRFSVMSVPTVILFRDGAEIDRRVGALPKAQLMEMVENAKK